MEKWSFHFYLVVEKSVKNEEESKQKRSLTPNPKQKKGERE